jgi:hypothetical protein
MRDFDRLRYSVFPIIGSVLDSVFGERESVFEERESVFGERESVFRR